MNRATVLELAVAMAQAQAVLDGLDSMNLAVDPDKRLTQKAEYALARDFLRAKVTEYNAAFEKWHQEGFPE